MYSIEKLITRITPIITQCENNLSRNNEYTPPEIWKNDLDNLDFWQSIVEELSILEGLRK